MKKLITIMASAAVLLFASQLYAAPVDLISAGSSGWEYRTIGGFAHQNLANNFWSLNYASVNWTTFWTGQAAFGNTQATAGQSALGNCTYHVRTMAFKLNNVIQILCCIS